MRVLEHQHRRLIADQAEELREHCFEGPFALALWAYCRRLGSVAHPHELAEQGRPVLIVIGGADHGLKRLAALRGRIVLGQLVGAFEQRGQRVERGVLMVWRTIAVDEAKALDRKPIVQGVHHARLADSRFAREQYDLTLAVGRLLAAADQQPDLLSAADQRGQIVRRGKSLKPAAEIAATEHPPRLHRLDQPFELMGAKVLEGEHVADQATSAVGHDDAIRRDERLQAHGHDRGGADDLRVAAGGAVHQLGHDHEAGRDADPHAQLGAVGGRQPADRVDQLDARRDRPFGVVFVRPRMAEAAKDAVAYDPDDRAVEAADLMPAGGFVREHDLAQILRIELLRKACEVDHVAEQHRELAPLTLGRTKAQSRLNGPRHLLLGAQVGKRRAACGAKPGAWRRSGATGRAWPRLFETAVGTEPGVIRDRDATLPAVHRTIPRED